MIYFKIIFSILIVSSFNLFEESNGARILSIYSTFSRSHFIVAEALLKELARQGHNVRYEIMD